MLVSATRRFRYICASVFKRALVPMATRAPLQAFADDDDDDRRRIFDDEDRLRREPDFDATPSDTLVSDKPKDLKNPREIVSELDRYIIGQDKAKQSVAIAIRNRWRRQQLPTALREEVVPKNILMIGPTGCGKTEVARRLAKMTDAPFIKVEATKFTEVGFHGRDVDTIIRDLVRIAIQMRRQKKRIENKKKISQVVEDKLLDLLVGDKGSGRDRESFRALLRKGELDSQSVDADMPVKDDMQAQLGAMLAGGRGKKTEKKRKTVGEYKPILMEMELDRVTQGDEIIKEAIKLAEQEGIVVIDEIDKIVSNREYGYRSADASAEGVQRDLLPLIEGTTVATKYGNVDTTHILFIASGAFHSCKPSDMLAELQGRLPIRVELKELTEEDLYRILTVAENNLLKQQVALLATEKVKLIFTDGAIRQIAKVTAELNKSTENIGARRLHTVIERVVSDISFKASDIPGSEFTIDEDYVNKMIADFHTATDLRKYIL